MGWPRPNLQELASKRFGFWEILGPAPSDHRGRTRLRCRCHGCNERTERDVLYASLKRGQSKSCGCRRVSGLAASRHVHGAAPRGARSITLKSYKNLLRRYGERVPVQYRQSFESFVADVGERPNAAHHLRVIDTSLPPFAWNLRWEIRRSTTIPKNVARAQRRVAEAESRRAA